MNHSHFNSNGGNASHIISQLREDYGLLRILGADVYVLTNRREAGSLIALMDDGLRKYDNDGFIEIKPEDREVLGFVVAGETFDKIVRGDLKIKPFRDESQSREVLTSSLIKNLTDRIKLYLQDKEKRKPLVVAISRTK